MRVGLAAVLLLLVASPASVGAESLESRIVFQRMVAGDQWELFSVRPDGRAVRRLTRSADWDMQPAWAPDRSRLVALRGSDLVVRARSGAVVRSIAVRAGTATYEPRWSPDGRWISYLVERCEDPDDPRGWVTAGCADLWIVRPDGSRRRRLVGATVATAFGSPSYTWSPDGRAIVYQGIVTHVQLVRVEVRSGRKRAIPHTDDIYAAYPSISPDGRWIAFARQRGAYQGCDLYAIRSDGSRLRRLVSARNVTRSRWSPDGRRIAYFVDEPSDPDRGGNRYGLFVARRDGTAPRRLATSTDDSALVWSPDSSRVAWAGDEALDESIYVARADGRGRPIRVARGSEPDWR